MLSLLKTILLSITLSLNILKEIMSKSNYLCDEFFDTYYIDGCSKVLASIAI